MWRGFWFHHNNFAVPKVEKNPLPQGLLKQNLAVEKLLQFGIFVS
jgi:hypothetical protein